MQPYTNLIHFHFRGVVIFYIFVAFVVALLRLLLEINFLKTNKYENVETYISNFDPNKDQNVRAYHIYVQ